MLRHSLRSALAFKDFAEIIIVSNGDSIESDIPEEFLGSKYIQIKRSKSRLSMSENWQFGFQFVNARWVYFLGDDDIMIIDPMVLNKVLDSETLDGIVFSKKFFQWDDSVADLQVNIKESILPSRVLKPKIPNKFNWVTKNLNKYPSGAGASIVRYSFLEHLNKNNFLFQGISPDWSNAAYYLHHVKEFKLHENKLVSIGFSNVSSIQLHRNPTSLEARTQIELASLRISSYLSRFPIDCPTTWLSRIDSMYRARKDLNFPIFVNKSILEISSLITTPRYVLLMCSYLRRSGSSVIKLSILFFPMLFLSFINKLKFLFTNFYRKNFN
jgi:hypothetical protein